MRHAGHAQPLPSPTLPGAPRTDWATLRRLAPYLLEYRWRVLAALVFMVGAKLANVGVPVILKEMVDAMTPRLGPATLPLLVPAGLLLAYGLLRLSTSLFTELREASPCAPSSTCMRSACASTWSARPAA